MTILKIVTLIFLFCFAIESKTHAAANKVSGVAVSVQSGSLSAGTGGSVTYTVTLTCTGGTAGTSTQSINWTPPAGATVVFNGGVNPVVLPNAALSVTYTLTLSTTAATPAGVVPFTITTTLNAFTSASANFTVNCASGLSGSYNIGSAQVAPNYTTIAAAITGLNNCGVSGPVVFNLMDASYSESITISAITGASATNSITFRPNTGVTTTISASNATAIIDLNAAKYIIIDGSPGSLTISNTNTSGAAIRLINDASNNTIKYCDIQGVSTSATSGVILISTTTGSAGNDGNIIEHNNIHDGATTPTNIIYSAGTSTKENSGNIIRNNNIYNFFLAAGCSGILIADNCTDFTISDNSIYQTTSRAPTGYFRGIDITNTTTTGNNFLISGNHIGGILPLCAGVTPLALTNAGIFNAINVSIANANLTTIRDNIIANISVTSSNASTNQSLIFLQKGSILCDNNDIGSQSLTGNITYSLSSTQYVKPIDVGYAGNVAFSTSCTAVISNNTIGGITVSGIGNTPFAGIYVDVLQVYSSCTISDNVIGSTTTSNSISSASDNAVQGIYSKSACSSITISGNNILNITATTTGTTGFLYGIYAMAGSNTITSNIITKLTSSSTNIAKVAMSGIAVNSNVTGHVISNNTIHSLKLSNASGVVVIIEGIIYTGATTGTNVIEKNFIHSLETYSTGAKQRGIMVMAGTVICKNNMIRLGINIDGSSITTSALINGICHNSSTACSYYNNSVYIGGSSVVSGTVNTAAFYEQTGASLDIRNNIFVNNRSNISGTGLNYAYCLGTITGLTSDYNIYFANGTGGNLASINFGTTPRTTMQAFRFVVPGQDLHSGIGDPLFTNATGTPTDVNLHVSGITPAEGAGIAISGVTDDIDGNVRSTSTPTDIGADAGSYTTLNATSDIFTPVITYTPFTNGIIGGCAATERILNVTITDQGTSVPTSGGNVPRIWFNKNAGSWFSAPGTFLSGDGNNGTWTFTITYSTMGGVIATDIIYYYVVAQDQATTPNIWHNSFEAAAPIHSSVSVQTTPPASPRSYTFTAATLSGTITVGTTGTYHSLTEAGAFGLFNAINTGVVTGNITATIITSIAEPGTVALNQWSEDCGQNFTLLIYPTVAGLTLSGSTTAAVNLIDINGADRVTFDGRVNLAGDKNLIIINNYTTGTASSAIRFGNDATNNTIQYCILKGVETSTMSGVVLLNAGVTTGNDNITISNCDITGGTTAPKIPIYTSTGSAGKENSGITISNNNIYNFTAYGVYINTNNIGWTVYNNSFYSTLGTSAAVSTIYVTGGDSHQIRYNYIGGQAALCAGSAWVHSTSNFTGIRYTATAASTATNLIEYNTVQNINSTSIGYFIGIDIGSNTAPTNVKNNTIGHPSTANSIKIGSTSATNSVGINSGASSITADLYEGNIIANINLTALATIKTFSGIEIGVGDVKKNKIYKLGGTTNNASNIYGINFIVKTGGVGSNQCSNNMISLDGYNTSNQDHSIIGIQDQNGANRALNVFNNTVYIYGTATSTANTHSFFKNNAGTIGAFRNNLFVNARTGGTGKHLAISSLASASYNFDYNLYVVSNSTYVGQIGSGAIAYYDFATWKSSIVNEKSSWSIITGASSTNTQILPTDLFTDPANGDLSIKAPYATVDWFLNGKGIAGTSSGSLSSDLAGDTRGTTYQYSTDIGADEFGSNYNFGTSATGNQVSPHTLTLSTWALNTPQTFTFMGKNVATLEFKTGTPPTSVDVKFYSGDNPEDDAASSLSSKNSSNSWWSITPTGGSGYTYDLTLYYDNAMLGSIASEAAMSIAKWQSPYGSNSWETKTTTINTTNKTGIITGQSTFSKFAFMEAATSFPIELLSFKAYCDKGNIVKTNWTTASEINNDYFIIQRSPDLQNFEEIAKIKGAGSSNKVMMYEYADNKPIGDKSYYKLTQVDFDGKQTEFAPIFVICKDFDLYTARVYPNPIQGNHYTFEMTSGKDFVLTLLLTNSMGQVCQTDKVNIQKGFNSIVINVNNYKSGLHTLTLIPEGE